MVKRICVPGQAIDNTLLCGSFPTITNLDSSLAACRHRGAIGDRLPLTQPKSSLETELASIYL